MKYFFVRYTVKSTGQTIGEVIFTTTDMIMQHINGKYGHKYDDNVDILIVTPLE